MFGGYPEMDSIAVAENVDHELWSTFDRLEDHLYNQFQNIPFVRESGDSPDELREIVEKWITDHPEQPRVLQKAHAFRIILERGQIYVDPDDWFADKLNHGGLIRDLNRRWLSEAKEGVIQPEADECKRLHRLGAARAGLDTGHISPGWENMFRGGLSGLIAQVQKAKKADTAAAGTKAAFYEAVEIVYRAAMVLAKRFSHLAETMEGTDSIRADRLRIVADICRKVPGHAPETFHEALQFAWIMHELIEMEGEPVRSMGHFDRIFHPFYRADIDNGRISRAQAKELIKFFWIHWHARTRGRSNGKNFLFGGQDAHGNPVENDLTYLALEAYDELNIPDPKLSVRYTPETTDKLYFGAADCIRRGRNSFVLINDEPAVESLIKQGKTPEDARIYLPIGCYEPAVDGKEAACTMNIMINMAKPVELALHEGKDYKTGEQIGPKTGDPKSFKCFDDFLNVYFLQLDFIITEAVRLTAAHERQWPMVHPSPLVAGTIEGCIEKGKDVGEGGPVYSSVGCVGTGLANACDSLFAIKKAVYDDKAISIGQIVGALDIDFEGREPLRQYLRNQIAKWGNDSEDVDKIAKLIADHYSTTVDSLKNGRGGKIQAALFSLRHCVEFGEVTAALPDGRRSGESLSPGVGAMTGLDRNGATAHINSAGKLDYTNLPNGSVLDIMLHPSGVSGEKGLQAFVNLIKGYFHKGGFAIQFNVVDQETLRDAQKNPEKYANLQIRVTGWSVYYVNLSKEEQDHFISRVSQQL